MSVATIVAFVAALAFLFGWVLEYIERRAMTSKVEKVEELLALERARLGADHRREIAEMERGFADQLQRERGRIAADYASGRATARLEKERAQAREARRAAEQQLASALVELGRLEALPSGWKWIRPDTHWDAQRADGQLAVTIAGQQVEVWSATEQLEDLDEQVAADEDLAWAIIAVAKAHSLEAERKAVAWIKGLRPRLRLDWSGHQEHEGLVIP